MNRQLYHYEGPVMCFGTYLSAHWSADTVAISEVQARTTFRFQYKKLTNKAPSAKIDLPGSIYTIE